MFKQLEFGQIYVCKVHELYYIPLKLDHDHYCDCYLIFVLSDTTWDPGSIKSIEVDGAIIRASQRYKTK